MNGWFLAVILLSVLSIGINLAKDGEPKEERYSFIASLIGSLIQLGLIYMAIKAGF